VAAMGPDQLLVLLPLELDGADLLKSRVWLLPILKQHTVGARLQFFSSTLLPLAARLRERARKVSFSSLAELYHFKFSLLPDSQSLLVFYSHILVSYESHQFYSISL
jgi:hypothetical protein